MDATAVLYLAKWLVAELVRLLHTLSVEQAHNVVEGLMEREVPWVWESSDVKRVLRVGLTWRQQTLVLLLSESGPVSEANLVSWLEHPRVSTLRKDVLLPLHRARQIEYDAVTQTVRLLPPGLESAEALVASSA